MASLSFDEQSGVARVHFRFAGRQFQKSLKTADEKKARAMFAAVEETLHDLERGRLEMPPDSDLWEFLKTGGKREQRIRLDEVLTLEGLFKWYFASLPEGAKGNKTNKVETIHANHFKRLLGAKKKLSAITGQDLQEGYLNRRAKEKGRYGQPIDARTMRKEVGTLRMVWNRACRQKVAGVGGPCPCADLQFPKDRLKPHFQPWEEIERTLARGGLSEAGVKELWDSLFLDLTQTAEVLKHVRTKTTRRHYFAPLLVFVAHTGARLSEAIRSQVADFDFEMMRVKIREKKRDKSSETYRWVPLSPFLAETMQTWFKTHHPGGAFAFCRLPNKPFHEQTLHDDFEWFMKNSKWTVLKGFHVFRHSFASNLARKGVDQREIDGLLGHQTEAMRRRYRHLFPAQRENAIRKLFG